MSVQDYEAFYGRILDFFVERRDISELFDDDALKDKKKMDWVLAKSAEHGIVAIISIMLSRGITVGVVNEKNQTVIHVALCKKKFGAINLLFPYYGSSINYIDDHGLSHFHAACIVGNTDAAENFLKNGIDANDHFDYEDCKQAPLHVAVKFNQGEIVKILLKYGADPNSFCSFGLSPLHLACSGDLKEIGEILHLLVRYKSGHWDAYKRLNTYFEQKYKDEIEISKILIDGGCNVNIRNRQGDTPMNCVFKINHFKNIDSIFPQSIFDFHVLPSIIDELRIRQNKKIDILLSKGADVKIANNKGNTVLHLAIRAMKEFRRIYAEAIELDDEVLGMMVTKIFENGADVNAKNKKGQSPLQLAVSLLNFKTVKILLLRLADFSDIHFDWFYYNKDLVPCFMATDKLINIVYCLENQGFHLNQKDNLNILKFLVINNIRYEYVVSTDKEAFYKLKNLLEYGTDFNIRRGLENFLKNTLCNNEESKVNRLKRKTAIQIYDHLMILERGNLYASQDIKDLLWSKINNLTSDFSEMEDFDSDITKEFKFMKQIVLSEGTSFRDILTTSPQYCYWRIQSGDYMQVLSSLHFKELFANTLGIIEGHFAKTLVRRYVVESARDYLTTLIDLSLPDECCDQIFEYLSNESLYNLCVAAINDE